VAWATTARAHDGGDDRALRAAIEHAERSAPPGKRPIVETHIHFWQVTRPGGVPWPTPAEGPIFRDVLPRDYTPVARANGVVMAGIVEASGIVEDNQWILDLVRHDRFYSFFVGNLEIGRRPSPATWRVLRTTRASWAFAVISPARRKASRSARHSSPACATWHSGA
jgi:hypothetical protein